MDKYIMDRVLQEATYIIKNNSTVRDAASVYNVSKSTVHKDLKDRLPDINMILFEQVEIVFKDHIETRHIRGGEATKQKYLKR